MVLVEAPNWEMVVTPKMLAAPPQGGVRVGLGVKLFVGVALSVGVPEGVRVAESVGVLLAVLVAVAVAWAWAKTGRARQKSPHKMSVDKRRGTIPFSLLKVGYSNGSKRENFKNQVQCHPLPVAGNPTSWAPRFAGT